MLNRELRPSLYCVEIRTNQWQRMVDWYRHTLGLRVLMRVTDDGYALIEAGETRIALLDRDLASEPNGRWSMGFEVQNLRKIADRLDEANIAYTAPKKQDEGFLELVTADPDGNTIRLFSWPTM